MMDYFFAIIETSAVMSAAILLLVLLGKAFDRKTSPSMRHLCWLIVVASLLIPYRLALLPQLPSAQTETPLHVFQPTYVAGDWMDRWSSFRNDMQATSSANDFAMTVTGQPGVTIGGAETGGAPSIEVAAEIAVTPYPVHNEISPGQILVLVWAAGAAVFVLVFVLRHLRFVRAINKFGKELHDGAVYDMLRLIRCHVGIKREVRLIVCPIITVPIMHGLFRPTIVLPEQYVYGYGCEYVNEEQLQLMLLHEALHIKRGDILARLICLAAVAIHWFNPLVHIMNRIAMEESEKACDDAVIAHAGNKSRILYSQTLLSAAGQSTRHNGVLGFSLTSGGRKMKNRLINIMFRKRPKRWVLISFTAMLMAVVMAFGLVGFAAAEHEAPFAWPKSFEGQNPFYGETITVAVPWMPEFFTGFAQEYQWRNPGVTIEIIYLDDIYSAREQIGLDLIAGNAPTLIMGNLVDYHHPMVRPLFVDWLPIIYADPNFNEEDWFMNVFEALTRDGRLMGFPISYHGAGSSFIVANSTIPGLAEEMAGRQSISFNEMMEIHSRISPTLDTTMYMERSFDVLTAVTDNIDRFLDFETGRVEFSSPEFINLITQAREITGPGRNFGASQLFNWYEAGNRQVTATLAQQYLFRKISLLDIDNFGVFEEDLIFVNPLPYTNDRGELLIAPQQTMVLSADASNTQQALAMDFIRFITVPPSGQGDDRLHHNRFTAFLNRIYTSPARGHASSVFPYTLDWTPSRFSVFDGWRWAGEGWHEAVETIVAYANASGEMPMRDTRYAPEIVRYVIREVLHQFHDGQITAEQAANVLQDRVSHMLLEMR